MGRPCLVCAEGREAVYECPRCNARYCGAACYRAHGVKCTEAFDRAAAADLLRAKPRPSEDERRRVEEMIRRVHEQAGEAEEELLLDGLRLEDLDEARRKRFAAFVARGVEAWTPWWETAGGGDPAPPHRGIEAAREWGPGAPPLPPPSRLGRLAAAPALVYCAADALFAYAFACRLYDGEPGEEGASVALHVSAALREDARHASAAEAVASAERRAQEPEAAGEPCPALVLACVADTVRLLYAADDAAARAFWHLRRLVRKVSRPAARKLEFYAAWATDAGGGGALDHAAAELREEWIKRATL